MAARAALALLLVALLAYDGAAKIINGKNIYLKRTPSRSKHSHAPPPVRKYPPLRRSPPPPERSQYANAAELIASREDTQLVAAILDSLPDNSANEYFSGAHNIYVPTDDAFSIYKDTLAMDSLDELLDLDPLVLAALLRHHASRGPVVPFAQLPLGPAATGLVGYNVTVTTEGGARLLRSTESLAAAVVSNLRAGQASVTIIDRVLVPFDALNPPRDISPYATLREAFEGFGLFGTIEFVDKGAELGWFLNQTDGVATVFAPSQEAWQAVQEDMSDLPISDSTNARRLILGDHIHFNQALYSRDLVALAASSNPTLPVGLVPSDYGLPGTGALLLRLDEYGGLSLEGFTDASVMWADIPVGPTGDVVVHIIDGLLISNATAVALGLMDAPPAGEGGDAPEVPAGKAYATLQAALLGEPSLSRLLTLAAVSGLSGALGNVPVPVTLFAPTNAAVEATIAALAAIDPSAPAKLSQQAVAAIILAQHIHVGSAIDVNAIPNGQQYSVGIDAASAGQVRAAVNSSGVYIAADVTGGRVLSYIRAGDSVLAVVDYMILSSKGAAALGLDLAGAGSGGNGSAPGPAPLPPGAYPTLMDAMIAHGQLGRFLGFAATAGLNATLANPAAHLTLFAPNDAAWLAALATLSGVVSAAESAAALALVVGDHVHLGARLLAADFAARQGSGNGTALPVGLNASAYGSDPQGNVWVVVAAPDVFTVAGPLAVAKVLTANVLGGQSVMHVTNAVVVTLGTARKLGIVRPVPPPPDAATPAPAPAPGSSGPVVFNLIDALVSLNLTTLLALNQAAAVTEVGPILEALLAAPFTLLAPTDAAFDVFFAGRGDTLASVTGSGNPLDIATIILPHLHFSEAVPPADFTSGNVTSLNMGMEGVVTTQLAVSAAGGTVTFSSGASAAATLRSGISLPNGSQIYIVDTVFAAT